MLTTLFIITVLLVMLMLVAYMVTGDTKLVTWMLIAAVVACVAVMAVSYITVPPAGGLGTAADTLSTIMVPHAGADECDEVPCDDSFVDDFHGCTPYDIEPCDPDAGDDPYPQDDSFVDDFTDGCPPYEDACLIPPISIERDETVPPVADSTPAAPASSVVVATPTFTG